MKWLMSANWRGVIMDSRRGSRGFTLIELLVVISIIGVLSGLLITNLVGVRGRAGDSRIKNDLRQLKSALRLYYNDFQNYPTGGGTLDGCGTLGTDTCTAGDTFVAGAADTMYMKELPDVFEYYSDGDEEFLLVGVLENASDTDIADSVTRCDPTSRSAYYSGTPAPEEYFACED